MPYGYPTEPNRIGEHIRKRRMELGLSQRKLAKLLGTKLSSIRKWENGRRTPHLRLLPRVIEFLEYKPWGTGATIGDQVRLRRQALGLTLEETARILGVGYNKLRRWEKGQEQPNEEYQSAIEKFLNGRLR